MAKYYDVNNIELHVGQGIRYDSTRTGCGYGIVMDVDNSCISIAPVYSIELDTKCYNDTDAVKEEHQHNVRLKDCPPPFSALYRRSEYGVYCYANLKETQHFNQNDCTDRNVTVIDNGACITKRMMKEILDHPWQNHPEKEKTNYRSGIELADLCNEFEVDKNKDDNGLELGE